MTPTLGPSIDMHRFAAGMRVVTALLCTLLLAVDEPQFSRWALILLLAYGLWAVWVLWLEAGAAAGRTTVLHFWIDVTWSCLILQLVQKSTPVIAITLMQPIVLASIVYGVTQGVALAIFGAAGVLLSGRVARPVVELNWGEVMLALAVPVVMPSAALLARPMNALRRRLALLDELDAQLDPRRGLEHICLSLAEQLRGGTQAEVVALVLPREHGSPAVVARRGDVQWRVGPDEHRRFEALLHELADRPVTYMPHFWRPLQLARLLRRQGPAASSAQEQRLAELSRLLRVRSLQVLPLRRYARWHGHLVVGYLSACSGTAALAGAIPDLLRIVEQAALVDQLQEESASHERARIGRDLHDSAIQPYLGLKYAVECVALRITPDNPARAEVDALAELVNGEVGALQELILGLRTGNLRGDNALVPAVRRQVRRFALLFGIEIELDSPETLPTSRALASALFHMVNEALNNVRKHTAARRVWIKLAADAQGIRLTVRDDGGSVRGRAAPDFLPGSLSERARELGGTLHITRPDGLNTQLVVQIPL